jgi:uncharacterized protein YjbJ (UPF0337 family)
VLLPVHTSYRVRSRRWRIAVAASHAPFITGMVQSVLNQREEAHVGILDKVKDKAEQLIGEAKEKIGQMTGNESLENAGKRDQLAGEVKEAGHDLRDKAAGGVEDVKDKISDDNK